MPDTDAPQAEPLTLTLEETMFSSREAALAAILEHDRSKT